MLEFWPLPVFMLEEKSTTSLHAVAARPAHLWSFLAEGEAQPQLIAALKVELMQFVLTRWMSTICV